MAFGPDGKSILIGTGSDGRSGAACLWDVATRAKLVGPLTHQDAVLAVAFNPDGKTVLTGSQDGTAQLWERDTNRPRGNRYGISKPSMVPCSPRTAPRS